MKISTGWLTVNRACNNHCKWCYARNMLKDRDIMDFDKAKKSVEMLKEKGARKIILIGGEPTIYPYFIQLIKFIRDCEMSVAVTSNGRRFSNLSFAKESVEAGVTNIDISIKALSEQEYKVNTGNYGLKEMIDGYHNLVQLGFSPSVSYVITSNNTEKIDKLIEFILSEDLKNICIQFVKPVVELEKSEEIMDIKDMGMMVGYIYRAMKENNIDKYSIEVSFPLCLIEQDVLESLIQENKIINCCHVPRGNGVIFDTSFKVLPCNHFAQFPFSEDPLELSESDSLEQLWKSDNVKEFRKKARCYPSTKCQTCKMWLECGGGCFTRWLFLNPKEYIE